MPVLRHRVPAEGGRDDPLALTRSNTLVVAPQWIGDAVMAEPLLATLARRGEALTVAALPWVAPVFRAMPEVQDVVELPFAHGRLDWAARRRVASSLRGRFDAAYVLPNSIKSALVPWLARIPLRVGYQGEGRVLLLNRRLPNPQGRPPMVAFYGALAGADFDAAARPQLQLDAAHDRRRARCRESRARRASGPSRPAPNTARPSAGRPSTTRPWPARCTPPTVRRSPCSDRRAKRSCANRSPPRRRALAASSPARSRWSRRWR